MSTVTELEYLRGRLRRALPHVEGGRLHYAGTVHTLPPRREALRLEIAAAIGSTILDNTDDDVGEVSACCSQPTKNGKIST